MYHTDHQRKHHKRHHRPKHHHKHHHHADNMPLARDARQQKQWEEDRDAEWRKEEVGKQGHTKTRYPEDYEGDRYTESTHRRIGDDEPEVEDHRKDETEDIGERHGRRQHPKTYYPPEYSPPKQDDDSAMPIDFKNYTDSEHISPMVQKHVKPVKKEKIQKKSDWWRDEPHKASKENVALGSAMIEENEKERALELYRVHEE